MTMIAMLTLLAAATQAMPPAEAHLVLIAQDTPVELMALTEVSTAHAKPGSPIKLRVNKPITVDGKVVVPIGTPAFGEVVMATDAGGLGKSGVMSAKLVRIQLGKLAIPLEGALSAKGTGSGSAGVAAILAGPLGLFRRGNNAKIKAGEIVAGYVAEDVALPQAGQ